MRGNWDKTVDIVRETFSLVGKDKSLYIPPLLNLILGFCIFTFAGIIIITGYLTNQIGLVIIGVFTVGIGFILSSFLDAALSWMVLEVVQGKDTTLMQGLGRAFKKSGSVIAYGIVSFIIMLFVSQLRSKDSGMIVNIVKSFFANVVEEAWDIAGHFLLPAIILQDHKLSDAIKELPKLTSHIPQALVGGFAFDFIVNWLYFFELLFSLLVVFLLFSLNPVAAIIIGIALLLGLILVTYLFYSFTKSVYFTLMYIDMHPELRKKR